MSPVSRDAPHQLRHLPGMVLIHRDDEPSRIGLFLLAEPAQFIMGIRDDRPQPTVLQERGLEPFPLQLESESILEGRPMFAALRQPGQLPLVTRKQNRTADVFANRLGIAIGEIGPTLACS